MSPEIEALGSIPRALIAAALLLAAAFGAGRLLIKLPVAGGRQILDAVLLRTVVGLNLIGAIGVALGQLKLLAGGNSFWLLAGCSFLNLPEFWRWWRRAAPKLARPGRRRRRFLPRLPRGFWLAM